MISIIYEGIDISNDINVNESIYVDSAGGHADSLSVAFSDTKGIWSSWKPKKGHKIELIKDNFSTGTMYIDQIIKKDGKINFGANSIPPGVKSEKNRTWENVKFKQIATDIAYSSGLQLNMHSIDDFLYKSLSQVNTSDLKFLNLLCLREGYVLKISNDKMIIFNEKIFENAKPVKTFKKGDIVSEFKTVSLDIFSECAIKYMDSNGISLDYNYKPLNSPLGSILKIEEMVSSQSEAERFTKNYLRSFNKFETTGLIFDSFENYYTTCNTVTLDVGDFFDGNYFIFQTIDNFVTNKRLLKVRHILEGY